MISLNLLPCSTGLPATARWKPWGRRHQTWSSSQLGSGHQVLTEHETETLGFSDLTPMTHISAKVNGVEVPVQICLIHAEWKQWICLCKSLRVIASGLLHIVWKEFVFIFVWRTDLLQSLLGDYFFSLCKLCLASFSLLLFSVSNAKICILTYYLNRHVCRVGPLQESQCMAVLCYKFSVLIVTHRSCRRKVSASVLHG